MNNPVINLTLQVTMVAGMLAVVYLLVMPVLSGYYKPGKLTASRSVLEISDNRRSTQHMIITRATNILEDYPGIRLEVVASGHGVNLLIQGATQHQAIHALMNKGVIFTACQNSLQQLSDKASTPPVLLPGVRLAQDGHRYAEQLKDDGYIDELA